MRRIGLYILVIGTLVSGAWLVYALMPWSLVFLAFVVIFVVVALLVKRKKSPPAATDSNLAPGRETNDAKWKAAELVTRLVITAVVAGLVVYTCRSTRQAVKTWANRPQPQPKYRVSAPAPPPVIKAGKEPIFHRFKSDGCVETWLEGNWVSYPQPLDEEIRFFDRNGLLVLEQGAKRRGSSLPPALYRICKAPGSDATGVEIWN